VNIQDFSLELDNDVVPWRLFTPDESSKEYCVLWLQGWTASMNSHREGVERMSEKSGLTFATLDYAGHGLHALPIEESTRKQQHEEVIAIFDELRQRGYEKVIVAGGSFGAYMTALLTNKRPVHAVVLRAPANYMDEEFEIPYKRTLRHTDHAAYEEAKRSGKFLDSLAVESLKNFDGYTYVLEHELDKVVPAEVPKRYFAVAKHGNYLLVPKTDHSPKAMDNPQVHFYYIEHLIISIIQAIQLQGKL
jgi:uncharacterized protein